jgi:hypothetical protein
MPTRPFILGAAIFLGMVAVAPLRAAEAPGSAAIVVTGPSHAPVDLTVAELASLPKVRLQVAFLTEHGPRAAFFEGPLLWAVLQKAGAIDPAKPREAASESIVIIGRDGYRAVLALGEIAPQFEGKQVLLAESIDDRPLGAGHMRVVVPLDKRGGRSVREVTRIEVSAAPP